MHVYHTNVTKLNIYRYIIGNGDAKYKLQVEWLFFITLQLFYIRDYTFCSVSTLFYFFQIKSITRIDKSISIYRFQISN